jgi:hypothetical protein
MSVDIILPVKAWYGESPTPESKEHYLQDTEEMR